MKQVPLCIVMKENGNITTKELCTQYKNDTE
jgi:hypothetical protein